MMRMVMLMLIGVLMAVLGMLAVTMMRHNRQQQAMS